MNKKIDTSKPSQPQRARKPRSNNAKKDTGKIAVLKVPVAQTIIRTMPKPKITTRANGDSIITHREYIGEIAGTVAFATSSYNINPGLANVFPWLSAIANNYESYKFTKLKFCYETEAPTSQTGGVFMAVDYDVTDSPPLAKQQMMAYRGAVRTAPWAPVCLNNIQEDLHKRSSYYTRFSTVSANSNELQLYDTGVLYVGTQGNLALIIGELYVEYTIHLMTPQLLNIFAGTSLGGKYTGNNNGAPFGTFVVGFTPFIITSTGTTTSSSTLLFTRPWSGYISISVVGTTLGTIIRTGTSTFRNDAQDVDTAGTFAFIMGFVVAPFGSTCIYSIPNATITNSVLIFGTSQA